MAFLDFIKIKQPAPTPPSPQPASEPATNAVQSLSAEQLKTVAAVSQTLREATAHIEAKTQAPRAAAGDSATNAALLQKQNDQDKMQAALSPTDKAKGKTATSPAKSGWSRGR